MQIETKLEELGLALPEPAKPPPGIELSFEWVRVRGSRALCLRSRSLEPRRLHREAFR